MVKFFNLLLVVFRIFVIVKILILLYDTRNGFNDSMMESSIRWMLFLVFDIWIQVIIPIKNNEKD